MRSMPATEAALNFSAVLEAVEAGETIVLTRDGSPVARFAPETTRVVDQLTDIMERYPVDPEWANDLERTMRELRAETDQEREWPE